MEGAGSGYHPRRVQRGTRSDSGRFGAGAALGVRDTAAVRRLRHRARAAREDETGPQAGRWRPEQASQGDCEFSCRSPSQSSAAAGLGGGGPERILVGVCVCVWSYHLCVLVCSSPLCAHTGPVEIQVCSVTCLCLPVPLRPPSGHIASWSPALYVYVKQVHVM